MANISGYIGINSGDAVLASVVSNNFSQIVVGINSSALNSDNYGISSIYSANISTNAILSQHISNSQIVAAHISNSAINHGHLIFASASNGCRVVQIGASSTNMPAGGIMGAAITQTGTLASTASLMTLTHYMSDAVWGNPGYTSTPVANGIPVLVQTPTTISGPMEVRIRGLNSVSAEALYRWSASIGAVLSFTAHACFDGPK